MASSHHRNSEDSDAGYPEPGCRGDGKVVAAAAGLLVEGHGSSKAQLLHLALEAGPAYRLARLSELIISSGSVARSCRSPCIPP